MDKFDIICIDLILKKLNEDLRRYEFISGGLFRDVNNGKSLNDKKVESLLRLLERDNIITVEWNTSIPSCQLTFEGIEVYNSGYEIFLNIKKAEYEKTAKIESLKEKELRLNVFKLKNWGWFLILNLIVTIIASITTVLITKWIM